jgi:cephalosporin hydroxylase
MRILWKGWKIIVVTAISSVYARYFYHRVIVNPRLQNIIQNEFHKLYYYSSERTWRNTHWLNTPTLKCPLDLWIYHDIIVETKPDIIIETGTAAGGSALFLATVCDAVNRGTIFTVDIARTTMCPRHKRIKYFTGSSTSEQVIRTIRQRIQANDRVMVILDSNHMKEHVMNELSAYSPLVTKGNYLVVEDTHLHGHPVKPHFPPGPMEAVHEFLRKNTYFTTDRTREKYYMTFFPGGFLKRIR